MRISVRVFLLGSASLAIGLAVACGGQQPSRRPAAPTSSTTGGLQATPGTPTTPSTPSAVTDTEVLAQVDKLLSSGLLGNANFSLSPLGPSGVPAAVVDVVPQTTGPINTDLGLKLEAAPQIAIAAPTVRPISPGALPGIPTIPTIPSIPQIPQIPSGFPGIPSY
jgi:hypothetical protein